MQGIASKKSNNSSNILINTIASGKVITVITSIISTISQATCKLIICRDSIPIHQITFELPQQETVFIDSKLFLTEGYSLKISSTEDDTTFTVMYDESDNE